MRIHISRPAVFPMLLIQNASTLLEEFSGLGRMMAGVGVYGPAAAYALVWELGSRRLKSPGPRTMWSTNRLGEEIILTQQAPHGYVTPVGEFWPIIEEQILHVDFGRANTAKEVTALIETALDNASHAIAHVISQRAPIDSGDLRSGIQGMDADEMNSMFVGDYEDEGTLII